MKKTSYSKATISSQHKKDGFKKGNKEEPHPVAGPADPVLENSFRGHKDTITSVGFNPNL